MDIKYFKDTDTLYLQLNTYDVAETRDLDENMFVDIDKDGHIVSITIEHAKKINNISDFSTHHILAKAA